MLHLELLIKYEKLLLSYYILYKNYTGSVVQQKNMGGSKVNYGSMIIRIPFKLEYVFTI